MGVGQAVQGDPSSSTLGCNSNHRAYNLEADLKVNMYSACENFAFKNVCIYGIYHLLCMNICSALRLRKKIKYISIFTPLRIFVNLEDPILTLSGKLVNTDVLYQNMRLTLF